MKTLEWRVDQLSLIDQTRLPAEWVVVDCVDPEAVATAIRTLQVRGAPALSIAAAYGVVLAGRCADASSLEAFWRDVNRDAARLRNARPTAVNLARAVDLVVAKARPAGDVAAARQALLDAADALAAEDDRANRQLGAHGAGLISDSANVLTHCNAGGLGTTGYGTALGVIRAAYAAGRRVHVWVDETRPVLQGARLTTWELLTEGIPHTLIVDGAAGFLMQRGQVDLVVVGADRVAANGDVANKIGTYSLAVLARHHGIPFYVASPISTIDSATPSGERIPIEERAPDEVRRFAGHLVAPPESPALNPAFDLTPAELVSGIITERGVVRAPYSVTLRALVEGAGNEPELAGAIGSTANGSGPSARG